MRTLFGDGDPRHPLLLDADDRARRRSRSSSAGRAGPARSATRSTCATPSRGGDLWDRVMAAGKPHDIRPIAPCEARRIEAGIFNYNSDMTIANNPFEIMGLERLVEPQAADYIGKAALEAIRRQGRRAASSSASRSPGDALSFEIAEKRPALHQGEPVGHVTDLIWSPAARAQHRLRLGPDRAVGAGHAPRDRDPRWRPMGGPDGGDPVPRRPQGGALVMSGARRPRRRARPCRSGTRPGARR